VHWRKSTNSKEAKATNSQEEKPDRILMRILKQFSESESVFNEASRNLPFNFLFEKAKQKFKKPFAHVKKVPVLILEDFKKYIHL
jgi:hypothetical protein